MSNELERQQALLQALLGSGDPHVTTLALAKLGLRAVQPATPGPPPSALQLGDEAPEPLRALDAGLQAYRGNAAALSERALAGAFPHLAQLLGEQFASLAWAFWRRCPPTVGDLGAWGDALPDFLMETVDDTLAGIAAFEWALHRVERAADASLDAASLNLLNGEPSRLGLVFRPGLTLLELPIAAVDALAGHRAWMAPSQVVASESAGEPDHRRNDNGGTVLDEGAASGPDAALGRGVAPVLVWRKDWRGRATQLEAAAAAFMRSALAGESIEIALSRSEATQGAALARAGEFWDFTTFLHQALRDHWLIAVRRLDAVHGKEECNDEPEPTPDSPTAAAPAGQRLPHQHG